MTTAPFLEATSVRRFDADSWNGAIQPGWDIAGNANGGYLMAIGARALLAATGRTDPTTVTAHFLAPGKPGPVMITPEVIRSGRRFSTATETLTGGSGPLVTLLGTFGDLPEQHDTLHVDGRPPELPPPDECVALQGTDTFPPPFMGKVDLRINPVDAGFFGSARSGRPQMTGWFRLLDGEVISTIALLCALDAFPPTVFNTELPVAWTPTLELTAHVRARPRPGWLRCRFITRFITGGLLEEDGELWDANDRLVAQSRQLALVPRT